VVLGAAFSLIATNILPLCGNKDLYHRNTTTP